MTNSLLMQSTGHKGTVISSNKDSPELAATYDVVSVHQFEHGKQLIASIGLLPGQSVLDIGAGTGRLGIYAAELVGPSGRVVGIDPLPLRIEIARTKANKNFEARVGCAEDLSEFTNESFDVVYLNSVFHWVEDKPRALAEIFRVLKPDGRLGLNCQHPDHPHESRLLVRRALVGAGIKLDPHIAYPSLGISGDALERQVKFAGFIGYKSELQTFRDVFPDVDALLAWSSSSTFGNFLVDVPLADWTRLRDALCRLLDPNYAHADGIHLKRYLTFSTASKPG